MNKKTLILIFGIGIVLLLLIIIALNSSRQGADSTRTSPKPESSSPVVSAPPKEIMTPDQDRNYVESANKIAEQEREYHQKRSNIADLVATLPYKGANFRLEYNLRSDIFDLYLDKQAADRGQNEYEAYIRRFGADESLMNVKKHIE